MPKDDLTQDEEWRPTASVETLKVRADFLSKLRNFFAARHIWEVETPLLSRSGATDVHLSSITARYKGPSAPLGQTFYLQTSPEFAMKRLLAAGSGAIYQICKVFRNGEEGRLHNAEFTMLEWYRPGFDDNDLMNEIGDLLSNLGVSSIIEKISYQDAFLKYVSLDPFNATLEELQNRASASGLDPQILSNACGRDLLLDFLITHLVEPNLGLATPTFLFNYPPSQAGLARINYELTQPVAKRFELYMQGVEIANGYHELGNSDEQRGRMESDLIAREHLQLPYIPLDRRLLAALDSGLPNCAGVAVGLDRLLMVILKLNNINDVVSFPIGRA